MVNVFVANLLGSLIRHAGTALGATLVASGYVTQSQSETLVGAVAVLATIAWSLIDGFIKSKKINKAKVK